MELSLRSLLDTFQPSRSGERVYLPITVPAKRLEALAESVAKRQSESAGKPEKLNLSTDFLVETILLDCLNERFLVAEEKVFSSFSQNVTRCARNSQVFMLFLDAFFIIQRLDVVSELIRIYYDVPFGFQLRIEEKGPGIGRVRWDNAVSGYQTFTFDVEILIQPEPLRQFFCEFPLFKNYVISENSETGSIIHNIWDMGIDPGLAYSDSRPDYFLVPDFIFVWTKGYKFERHHFRNNIVNWEDRSPVAFWRGSTSGVCHPGQWKTLERIKLCELGKENNSSNLLDVGISDIGQIDDPESIMQIKMSGLMRERIAWEKWNQYKYLIDIDGNSNAWSSLFQKLLTGSPVLKVESSRGLRQWFYSELIPWYNYVPIAPLMGDLVDKINWLRANDSIAQKIGERGLELANKLSYSREMALSVDVISAAFRYFKDNSKVSGDDLEISQSATSQQTQKFSQATEFEVDKVIEIFSKNGFDLERYFLDNPDLRPLNDMKGAITHLIVHGFREGRRVPVEEKSKIPRDLENSDISTALKELIGYHIKNHM